MALFSRVSGPAVLNQRTRELIYTTIQQRPGSHYRGLRRELGLSAGTLTHHLATLERERLITRKREGLRLFFYPGTARFERAIAINPWQSRLLSLVRQHPDVTQSEAARQLGLTRQALHYHVNLLRDRQLIEIRPEGRESRLRMAPAQWARVGTCPQCSLPFEVPRGPVDTIRCPQCNANIRRPAPVS